LQKSLKTGVGSRSQEKNNLLAALYLDDGHGKNDGRYYHLRIFTIILHYITLDKIAGMEYTMDTELSVSVGGMAGMDRKYNYNNRIYKN
jgi:hypothetical protein